MITTWAQKKSLTVSTINCVCLPLLRAHKNIFKISFSRKKETKTTQRIFGFNCVSEIEYLFLFRLEPVCPSPWDAGKALLPGEGTEKDQLGMAGRKGIQNKFTIFQKKPWNWVCYVIQVLCIKLLIGKHAYILPM